MCAGRRGRRPGRPRRRGLAILGLIPKITQGRHLDDPRLRLLRARRVLLMSEQDFQVEVDGELPFAPLRRLQVDVLPGRLTVVV